MLHKNSEFLKVFDHIFTDGCTAHTTAPDACAHRSELCCTGDAEICFGDESHGTSQSQKFLQISSLQETQLWTVWEVKLQRTVSTEPSLAREGRKKKKINKTH